ncbi:MAG: toll/interleukin-1 receptor domain-containing protein [Dehalococcoidia bacterium]
MDFWFEWEFAPHELTFKVKGIPVTSSTVTGTDWLFGMDVNATIALAEDPRWKNLRSSLERLRDALGQQKTRYEYKGAAVGRRGLLVGITAGMWSLRLDFLAQKNGQLTAWNENLPLADLEPALQRIVSSTNTSARAIVEERFESLYGGRQDTSAKEPMRKARHVVFLSHNKNEKPLARRLAEDLYRQGVEVWFDEWEILAGDSVVGKIEEGLERSTVFVMVVSAAFQNSDWCTAEYRNALTRAIETEKPRVIPILREDVEVPPLVRHVRRIDLREDSFYDTAIEELLNAIYGISPRPPE